MSADPLFSQQGLIELNKTCYCYPIARHSLEDHIISESRVPDMASLLAARENYFASTAVFITKTDAAAIQTQISAIETAVQSSVFQNAVHARGYNTAYDTQTQTRGVFMGYDFHMTDAGPRLIEINSNAGGAFIVNALEQSIGVTETQIEDKIGEMFVAEWQRAGRKGRPKTIAIIDESLEEQYHYPDMCLAADVLTRQGFDVVIADPKELIYQNRKLKIGHRAIDLIYNRLTDFSLTGPYVSALSRALIEDSAVITPNPRHHALHADKRNLALLSNPQFTQSLHIEDEALEALTLIPETYIVDDENAEQLWADRRQYFFKPYASYGGKGVYRGAKLTTKVWSNIKDGKYIAQKFIPPSLRAVTHGTQKAELKFDMRAYTYDGKILGLAARMYRGQTTNLRTPGGGLAPVLTLEKEVKTCAQ